MLTIQQHNQTLEIGQTRSAASKLLNITSVIVTAYDVGGADDLVRYNPAAGGFAITLPAVSASNKGRLLRFKNVSNDTNVVVLTPSGGDLIDDQATLSLNQAREFTALVSNGTSGWEIVG